MNIALEYYASLYLLVSVHPSATNSLDHQPRVHRASIRALWERLMLLDGCCHEPSIRGTVDMSI